MSMGRSGKGLSGRFREHFKRFFTIGRVVRPNTQTYGPLSIHPNCMPITALGKPDFSAMIATADAVARRRDCSQSSRLSKRPSTETRNSERSLPYSDRLGAKSKTDTFRKPSELGDVKRSHNTSRADGQIPRISAASEYQLGSLSPQKWSHRNYHSDKTCSYAESNCSEVSSASKRSTAKGVRSERRGRDSHPKHGSNKQANSCEKGFQPPGSSQKQNGVYFGKSGSELHRPGMSRTAPVRQTRAPLKPKLLGKTSAPGFEKLQQYQPPRKPPATVIVVKMTRGGELRRIKHADSQIRYRDNHTRSQKDVNDHWNDNPVSIETSMKKRGSIGGWGKCSKGPPKSIRFGYKTCRRENGTNYDYRQTQNSSKGDLDRVMAQRSSVANLTGDGGRFSPQQSVATTVQPTSSKQNLHRQTSSTEKHPIVTIENPANSSSLDNVETVVQNLCPTGNHEIVERGKSCICMQMALLEHLKSKSVLYEWHTEEPRMFDGAQELEGGSMPQLNAYALMKPPRISTGGQGTVAWVGTSESAMQYALKFKMREGRNEKNWQIERREAKILKKLKHPFVVTTYHIYETEDSLFMAFEYLSGGCLWNHLARIGTLPECYVTYYAASILTALTYLHEKGIVYRDLKAENIVLDYQNRPKLIDFGMAKYLPSVRKQMQAEGECIKIGFCETPKGEEIRHEAHCDWSSGDLYDDPEIETDDPPTRYYFAAYLAPEIYNEPMESNQFIDSWGLGYILVEMILGYGIFLPMPWANTEGQHLSPYWQLELPEEALAKVTPECKSFIFKMLMRAPHQRMSLKEAMHHPLLSRVPWKNLHTLIGPNLSKFRCPEDLAKSRAALHKAPVASATMRHKTSSAKKTLGGKSPPRPATERSLGKFIGDSSPQKSRQKGSSRSQSLSKGANSAANSAANSHSSLERRGNHRTTKGRPEGGGGGSRLGHTNNIPAGGITGAASAGTVRKAKQSKKI